MSDEEMIAVRNGLLFAIPLLIGLLSACGPKDQEIPEFDALNPDMDPSLSGPDQLAALKDGEVTEGEYRAGFERFRSCLRNEGYEIHSITEYGRIIDYSIPAEAVSSGVEKQCYQTEFQFVDVIWQGENSQETGYLDRLNFCLTESGEPTAATVDEAERAMADAGLDVDSCEIPQP